MSDSADRSKLFLLKSKIKRVTPPSNNRISLRTPPEHRSPTVSAYADLRAGQQRQPVVSMRPSQPVHVASRLQAPQTFVSTPQYVQAPRSSSSQAPAFPRSAPQVLQKQQSALSSQPPEFASGEPLHQCADCGRKFNDESFPKHKKVCKKVFVQKRKVFDAAKVRLQAIAQEANKNGGAPMGFLSQARGAKPRSQPQGRPGLPIQAPSGRPSGFGNMHAAKLGPKNQTGWREKSAQFRAAIGSVRKENSGSNFHGDYPGAYQSKASSQFTCPHCNRGFNEEAGKRHSLVCLKIFSSAGGRLQKGSGVLSHSTTRKIDSTSLRLGGTPSRTPAGRQFGHAPAAPAPVRRR